MFAVCSAGESASIYLSIYLPIYLSIYLCVPCLSIVLGTL